MLRDDIAIIGISGIYPGADDLRQFYLNLAGGVDSIGPVPDKRKALAGLDPAADCPQVSTIERVDEFDHSFFNISLSEAESMDPHHRLLLQLTCAAIEDAGYGLGEFRGTPTAVIVGSFNADYIKLFEKFDPTGITGNLPAALAGRIAYALDLRGPAMVIDTACSSSLVAIHEACKQIRSGEVDCAIAGGIALLLFMEQGEAGALGIFAPDGRSKTFDASANGAGWGEGGGVVLLKSLGKALADKDHIYAVIKGGAVNQDGGRSNGIAAPSPEAQRDVIVQAWKNADIDPTTISYIEAHGTGTELGDPIEIQGITEAFKRFTPKKSFCAISSVKTNIGHLGAAAGIAGLTKVVLSLKHGELFPSLHFTRPNPFCDFENAPVFVSTQSSPWRKDDSAEARRAGISSFGLTGTNAHMVVQEAPRVEFDDDGESDEEILVTVSAKTSSSLFRYAEALRSFLRETEAPLADIAYTLNKGRDDCAYRLAYVVKNKRELIDSLESALAGSATVNGLKASEMNLPIGFLFSGDAAVDQKQSDRLSASHPVYKNAFDQCLELIATRGDSQKAAAFASQYALYKLWVALGVSTTRIIGEGLGNLAVSVITGKQSLEQAISKASEYQEQNNPPSKEKLTAALAGLSLLDKSILLEMGTEGLLSRQVKSLNGRASNLTIIPSLKNGERSILGALAALYVNGGAIDWDRFYEGQERRRVSAPTYCFERTSCWISTGIRRHDVSKPAAPVVEEKATPAYGLLTCDKPTETQKKLAAIWGEVLKVSALDGDEDFFDLGGNSLNGTQVLTRIKEVFDVKLEFEVIYDYSTVKVMADYIDELSPAVPAALTPIAEPAVSTEKPKELPLSFGQQRLWFLDQLEPESSVYNIANALSLTGPLNVTWLERSVNEIISRHETLRTTFHIIDGEPAQVISPSLSLSVPLIDLTDLNISERQEQIETLISKESEKPFDLSQGPLIRVTLLKIEEETHVAVFTIHHIVSDGWSTGVLVSEFAELYRAFTLGRTPDLPTLPIQYADYAAWQREWLQGEELSRQLSYWKHQLDGAPSVLEIATDRPRPAQQSYRGAREYLDVSLELADGLREVCRREQVTLYMALLGAYQVLLSRYSGQDDVSVGTAIANRGRVETEGLIGFFVNTLVMRVGLGGEPTVREVLRRVKEAALGGYAHQDVPFEMLVEELSPERSLSYTPLFQAMFTLLNTPDAGVTIHGLTLKEMEVHRLVSKFDLSMLLTEDGEGIKGWVEYSTDLFERETIRGMIRHFQRVLEAIVKDSNQRVCDIELLSQRERELVAECNDTARGYDLDRCVHEMIEQQAAVSGDGEAVASEQERVSYRELNERANRLARYLKKKGVGAESRVGVMVERGVGMVAGMLGVMKAGGAYVPLDPEYPKQRLAFMLEDSQASVVITQHNMIERLPEEVINVICIDTDWADIALESEANPVSDVAPDNIAYVIYTSGSTGEPKGVAVEHRQLVNYVNAIEESLDLENIKTFATASTPAADLGNTAIFPALCRGKSLHIISQDRAFDPEGFADYIYEQNIECLKIVPSHFEALLSAPRPHRVPPRKRLILGGEASRRELVEKLGSLNPECEIFNHYGPTEATVGALTYHYDKAGDAASWSSLPIGRPIPNTQVYILDASMNPVPPGVRGELFIGGAGLARGYLNRAAATAERYVPDPFSREPGARLYKTGDLARLNKDGNIEFLGRADDQVKIRGHRIELAEIKAAITQHPSIRDCVVVAREHSAGQKRVFAYIVKNTAARVGDAELRAFISQRLPEYMLPSAFVTIESVPLTQNGKVDRRALPTPEPVVAEAGFVEPTGEIERILAQTWAEALGVERVGLEENFFELGGDSLTTMRVVTRLKQAGLHLTPKQIFQYPTVGALVRAVDAQVITAWDEDHSAPPITPIDRDRELPLSFAQQRMWFIDQLEPENNAYNLPAAISLRGPLNIPAFDACLSEMIRRHEVLRTRIGVVSGKPFQVIDQAEPLRIAIVDLQSLESSEIEVRRIVEEEAAKGFDLALGPLLKLMLLKIAPDHHILFVNMHHIISDRWSRRIMINEVSHLYSAYCAGEVSSLEDLPIQYADYAAWQKEWLQDEELSRQLSYWKGQLAGAPSVLELPQDRPRPAQQSHRGAREYLDVSPELAERLRMMCRREQVTLYMALLAAYQVLLSRYSGRDDISVGTAIANRGRVETERLVGFFVNTLVMRSSLDGDPTFSDFLKQVREVVLGAIAHEDLPFEFLVEQLLGERDLSVSPLFQQVFVYHNIPLYMPRISEVEVNALDLQLDTAKFDLMLEMFEAEGRLGGAIEYNTDLFDPDTIRRMAGHYMTLLECIIANPNQRLSDLQILTGTENRQLLSEWNDAGSSYKSDRCIHHIFEEQAERAPNALALSYETEQLTYAELDARANRLANYLTKLSVGPDVCVTIFLEPSIEMIVAVLGVLKAGGAYVPLEPSIPKERIAFILEDSRAKLLLTQSHMVERLPEYSGTLVCLDADSSILAEQSARAPRVEIAPENLAYVIYTSGSTGKPKGVLVTHSNVTRLLDATHHWFGFDDTDVWTLFHSYAFDFSVWELWGALCYGGRLVVVPHWVSRTPEAFYELARRERVTVLNQTPSAFQQFIRADEEMGEGTLSLRHVIFGGEALEFQSLKGWMRRHGEERPRLVNMYGITETTVHVTYQPLTGRMVEESYGSLIGRQIPDLQLYVLDDQLRPVPVGVPGELYVGGDGLARGYLNRSDLTAERFIPNAFTATPGTRLYKTGDLARYRPDGGLEYLGRLDNQVKIRGFRIELGEIESALRQHDGVKDAVVIADTAETGDKRLIAYLVTDKESAPGVTQLRSFLRGRLPEYMAPSVFLFLDSLPLTSNNKIDKRALPRPEAIRPDLKSLYVAPRTQTQEIIAGIWAELLSIGLIGVRDSFFELGGHSLLATQVISRVRETFNVEIPLRLLFESPTVADLAEAVEAAVGSQESLEMPPVEPAPEDAELALSFAQQRIWFINKFEPDNNFYNIATGFRITGQLNAAALEQSFNQVVARHEVLRTTIKDFAGQPVVTIDPESACLIPVVDISQLPSDQREEQIKLLATEEARKPFDLSRGPLLRVRLLYLGEDEHVALLTLHHIISDGWSLRILMQEVLTLYNSYCSGTPSTLAELQVQYSDYASWQRQWLRGGALTTRLSYWKKLLAGAPPLLELPTDRPRPPIQTSNGARRPFTLSPELSEALRMIARQNQVTLFMTLLGAFKALLFRYSGQPDIVVGTPVAGRNRLETENLIGTFVNTLALRTDFSGDPSFIELLSRVRKGVVEGQVHQDVPFEKVVDELQLERNLSHSPLFQVMFMLNDGRGAELTVPGLEITPFEVYTGSAVFDLALSLSETGGSLAGSVEYNTDLFDTSTIERMLDHFRVLLEGISADPSRSVSELPLLSDDERHLVIVGWNDTGRDFSHDVCAHELFEAQAERTPEAIAAVFEREHLTYRELNLRANKMANHLLSLGVGAGDLVAICMNRSVDMVVAILGVLKSGAAFLPLDPEYPKQRLAFMLEDARVPLLLTEQRLLDSIPPHGGQVICIDTDRGVIEERSDAKPAAAVTADHLAYVIYTSGSTGSPKGVMVAHRGLCNLAEAQARAFQVQADSRVLQFASLSFDAAVSEIFVTLAAGATLFLYKPENMTPGPPLISIMREQEITVATFPPSVLATIQASELPALKTVISAGEPCWEEVVGRWSKGRRFINAYGPTENTVCATVGLLDSGDERLSIGRPLENTGLFILNEHLDPVPVSVAGQIYISGVGLAWGYLNRPDLTAEKFIPNPFGGSGSRLYKTGDLARYLPDGRVEFIGRSDDQVKVRGYRIEPGEIEAVLSRHPAVQETVVVAHEFGKGDKRLVAYVVPRLLDIDNQDPQATSEAEHVAQWQAALDGFSFGPSPDQDIAGNLSGWNSSYTGQPIDEVEMKEAIDNAVERILSENPSEVLEIGCGSGILMERIAPRCSKYLGTDFAEAQLRYIERELKGRRPELSHVVLQHKAADDFDSIGEGEFDAVILNSVALYFPSVDYLMRVLKQAVEAITPGGFIFVGDMRSLPLLEAFHLSVELFKAEPTLTRSKLLQRARRRMAQERELLVDPAFFYALKNHLPKISDVSIQLKRGRYHNELTRFRYDVVIRTASSDDYSRLTPTPLNWKDEGLTLESLNQLLTDTEPDSLWVSNVPNARLGMETQALRWAHNDGGPETVREFFMAAASGDAESVDPEDFWALSGRLPYRVEVIPSPACDAGHYDVLLTRCSEDERRPRVDDLAMPGQLRELSRPWRTYSNNPMREQMASKLVPQWREFLKERLPDYMVASSFVVLDHLPLTRNGKVDKRALPAPDMTRPDLDESFVPAGTPVEKMLADIWADVLMIDRVGVNDDFIELGGDSILSIQVVARANRAGINVTIKQLLDNPTISALASVIESREPEGWTPRVDRESVRVQKQIASHLGDVQDSYPLTPLQQGMLFHYISAPTSSEYIEQLCFASDQVIDAQAFKWAWQELIKRHAILRTTFVWDGFDEPLQIVHKDASLPITEHDWRTIGSDDRRQRWQAHIQEEYQNAVFDLSSPPLMRLALIRFTDESYQFVLTYHHILLDGWSMASLMTELKACYDSYGLDAQPELEGRRPYKEYVEWVRSQDMSGAEAYWRETLEGFTTPTPLGATRIDAGDRQVNGYGREEVYIAAETTQELQAFARRNKLTLSTLIHGAWSLLLSRYSGEDDVVFGSVVSGRANQLPGVESVIGLLINTLPVRAKLPTDLPALSWLEQLQRQHAAAQQHDYSPLASIQKWSDLPKGVRLFESLLVFGNQPDDTQSQWHFEHPALEETGYPLYLLVEPGKQMLLRLTYDSKLFDDTSAKRLIGHFQTVLNAFASQPQLPLSEAPLVSEAEREQILTDWNNSTADFPLDRCFHQLFESQVDRTPDAIAAEEGGASCTYAELDRRANRLARSLVEQGVGPDVLVALLAERSINFLTAIIAVFKSGGAYLPIDPGNPPERIARVLEQSHAHLVLTTSEMAQLANKSVESLPPDSRPGVLQIEEMLHGGRSEQRLPVRSYPNNLAYVIFTSGSTGAPKGVMVEQKGMINHLLVKINDLDLTGRDIVAQTASQCFDISVWQFLAALLVGGRVKIFSDEIAHYPARQLDELEGGGVSIFEIVPSLLRMLLEEIDLRGTARPQLSTLRWLMPTGEALPPELCRQWLSAYPNVALMNAYGPTECSDDVAHQPIHHPPPYYVINTPIGRSLANMQLYVLDRRRQLLPAAVMGELYVGGVCVGRGYLDDPARTAETFVPDQYGRRPGARLYKTGDLARYLPDGSIEFNGRIDHQVKVRGFRIELGEIESVLSQHPSIRDVVVITAEQAAGDKRLVAYFVPPHGRALSTAELRRYLDEKLPDYMIPSAFVALESMPLTATGKVNRDALPRPDQPVQERDDSPVASRNLIEEALRKIWSEVLRVETVGVFDNFFELGGDSILSLQIVGRANRAGIKLTPKQMFQHQTIAELAGVATTTSGFGSEQGQVEGEVALTPVQVMFFDEEVADLHHWNQSLMFELRQNLDPAILKQALGHLLYHHDGLRASFVRRQSGWEQVISDQAGDAPLVHIDLRHLTEDEQAAEIQRMAASVQSSLDLAQPPLLRLALFDLGAERAQRLLIVIHHLVIDGVSWRVLLEDLQAAYSSLSAGQRVKLPPKTTSVKRWAELLVRHSGSAEVRSELSYWLSALPATAQPLPVDYVAGDNTEASAQAITLQLGAEETGILLQDGPALHGVQIAEALLTALTQAYTRWADARSMLIDVEGHGREEIFEDVDLSRTVGWFTSLFPLALGLNSSHTIDETLKSIRDQIRSVPHNGINYGVLRYLTDDAAFGGRLRSLPRAEMSFNYLGQFDQVLTESSPLAPASESKGRSRSARGRRRYLIDVSGAVADRQLSVTFTYSEKIHARPTVEALAQEFMSALKSIVAHLQTPEAADYALSSFSMAGLAEQELGKILETVEFEE